MAMRGTRRHLRGTRRHSEELEAIGATQRSQSEPLRANQSQSEALSGTQRAVVAEYLHARLDVACRP